MATLISGKEIAVELLVGKVGGKLVGIIVAALQKLVEGVVERAFAAAVVAVDEEILASNLYTFSLFESAIIL